MATAQEIQNAALAKLAELPIGTAEAPGDEEPDIATAVRNIYPRVRSSALYSSPWSWTLRREELEVALPDPDQEDPPLTDEEKKEIEARRFTYKLQLPAGEGGIGSIRALYSSSEPFADPEVDGWTRLGDSLYSTWKRVWLEYQTDIAEEQWPELFTSAVVELLTAEICQLIIEDTETQRVYARSAMMMMQNARRVDAQSKPNEAISGFGYIEARLGNPLPSRSPLGR